MANPAGWDSRCGGDSHSWPMKRSSRPTLLYLSLRAEPDPALSVPTPANLPRRRRASWLGLISQRAMVIRSTLPGDSSSPSGAAAMWNGTSIGSRISTTPCGFPGARWLRDPHHPEWQDPRVGFSQRRLHHHRAAHGGTGQTLPVGYRSGTLSARETRHVTENLQALSNEGQGGLV